jgi:hypothetical protein
MGNQAQLEAMDEAQGHRAEGDTHLAHLQEKRSLGHAGRTVMSRNREYKALTRHAVESDVSTRKDGGVLWTGDKRNAADETEVSAMKTAQAYAREHDKKTVEMTAGGGALDQYTRAEGNSYDDIMERFKYLEGTDGKYDAAKGLVDPIVAASGNHDLDDHVVGAEKNPAANIWDVLSRRFAGGLTGEAASIHGYDKADDFQMVGPTPLEKTDGHFLAGNTFNGIEKPAIEKKGAAQINEMWGDTPELSPYLREG